MELDRLVRVRCKLNGSAPSESSRARKDDSDEVCECVGDRYPSPRLLGDFIGAYCPRGEAVVLIELDEVDPGNHKHPFPPFCTSLQGLGLCCGSAHDLSLTSKGRTQTYTQESTKHTYIHTVHLTLYILFLSFLSTGSRSIPKQEA